MLRKFVEREEVLEFLRQGQNATCVRPETLVTQLRHKKMKRKNKQQNKSTLFTTFWFYTVREHQKIIQGDNPAGVCSTKLVYTLLRLYMTR